MTRKLSFPRRASACLAMAVVLLGCIACAAAEESSGKGKVNLDFKDAPVTEVVTKLAQQADISLAIQDEMLKDRKVTVQIRNADPEEALQLVCAAARLRWDQVRPGMWLIYPQPTVAVGGAEVPLLGAFGSVAGTAPSGMTYQWPGGIGISGQTTLATRSPFEGDRDLVELNVKDVSLSDAVAQLSKASGVAMTVHDSVPKEIKVTAKLYSVPLGQALSMIVNQANLTYTVGQTKEGKPEVHIVPKPELKVSGAGFAADVVRRLLIEGQAEIASAASKATTKVLPLFQCPKCHRTAMFPDWKFCPYCGEKLPPRDKDRPTSQGP